MANTLVSLQEVRVDVRNPEYTDVYVFVEITGGEHMAGVQGWHHNRVPASVSTFEIFESLWGDNASVLSWPLKNPEQSEEAKAAEASANREQDLMAAISAHLGIDGGVTNEGPLPGWPDKNLVYQEDGLTVKTYRNTLSHPDIHGNWFELTGANLYTILPFQKGFHQKVGVNGATFEAIIAVLIYRLRLMDQLCPSVHNKTALAALGATMQALVDRGDDRRDRGVYGTKTCT